MSHHALTVSGADRVGDPAPALRALRLGQHVLFLLLLTIGTLRVISDAQPRSTVPGVVGGVLLLLAWYASGGWLAARRGRSSIGVLWLLVLCLGWAALAFASVDFVWVAFALFLLCLHLLPWRWAVVAVGVLTAVVVGAERYHHGGLMVGEVLGPVLGAAVAVAMTAVYQSLVDAGEQRRRLVGDLIAAQDDLLATQDALAVAQRESGRLAERARLARDIHDTLAQGFSSVILLSRAAAVGGADQRETLRHIESTAKENLEEARRVVHELTPVPLDAAPLPAAIDRLVDRFVAQTGTAATFAVDGEPVTAATTVEVALLRVAQGALANVRQHARATRVVVTLSYGSDDVSLDVVDDGAGFAPDALDGSAPDGSGFGLRSMRERLAGVGGRLVVESGPGEGTAVAAVMPLSQPGPR